MYADKRIQWTTGDASGGTNGFGGNEAVAGIDSGDGVNFISLPGSYNSSIINITQTSNVGIPGTWIFKINQGSIIKLCDDCTQYYINCSSLSIVLTI